MMNMFAGLSLCFDLDGTLIDTAPDLVRVLNEVITADGLPETDFNAARKQVGRGAKYLITQAFERENKAISPEHAEELLAVFLTRYEDNIAELSTPYPHVPEVLAQFKRAGAKLSVCTNKPGYLARPLLEALGMTHYFDRIVGSRDGVEKKPNPAHIFAATGHRRVKDIIMIGDSLPDVLAAKQAGVPSIVLAYGYADTTPSELRGDKVIRSFRDLPETIVNLRIKRLTRMSQLNL